MLTGVNHVTISVRDLASAWAFYVDLLGLRPVARWREGAYLEVGATWICLKVDAATRATPHAEYTHLAFSVPAREFAGLAERLRAAGVREWQSNESEGDSLYLLDPDGFKLEIHVGDLASRLESWRRDGPSEVDYFVLPPAAPAGPLPAPVSSVPAPVPPPSARASGCGVPRRAAIRVGMRVGIVQKQDQSTGRLTEGVVAELLTRSPDHPHGITVRLQSGAVGRVKEILG